jgi:hypothetical protein
MKWTKEKPTKEGWYWLVRPSFSHEGNSCLPLVVEVYKRGKSTLCIEDASYELGLPIDELDEKTTRWSDEEILPPDCKGCGLPC